MSESENVSLSIRLREKQAVAICSTHTRASTLTVTYHRGWFRENESCEGVEGGDVLNRERKFRSFYGKVKDRLEQVFRGCVFQIRSVSLLADTSSRYLQLYIWLDSLSLTNFLLHSL